MVQAHALAALAALLLGIAQFLLPRGGERHRWTGRAWVALMTTIALTSFGITGRSGHYSGIHLLSIMTLVALVFAVRHAMQGRIHAHRIAMLALFWGALVVTGAFTLLPGRIMGKVVFGW